MIVSVTTVCAQDSTAVKKEKKWTLNGYVKDVQSVFFADIEKDWLINNLIHNRINFKGYISNSITTAIEVRNRFFYGDFVKYIPGYSGMVNVDDGILKATENLLSEKSYILNFSLDRAWIDYSKEKYQVIAGRQRINWGQTFVWNPNDIFNTYSYFDFDYEEKPGSDAVRIQYYPSATSRAEIAVKANGDEKITAAGLFRFNRWNYDFQFICGMLNETDYVAGAGWSGQIAKGGFRGEASYFHPKNKFEDTTGIVVASAGYDYMFKNSLFLQCEFLFNSNGEKDNNFDISKFYFRTMTPKNLSFTRFSMFSSLTYPFSPLVKASFAAMYNPENNSFFVIPSVDVSLKENLDLSFISQVFYSDRTTEGNKGVFVFARLKWSF